MKKHYLSPILLICIASMLAIPAFANDDDIDPVGDPPPASVPFDGGLSLMIAASVGYGAKKAYDSRKKKDNG